MPITFDNAKIEITNECDLDCPFCYLKNRTTMRDRKFMKMSKFKEIVNFLEKLGVYDIRITGGEPLLHKNLNEMLSYLKRKNFKIRFNTNGFLLTKGFIEENKNIIYKYHLSLHRLDKEIKNIALLVESSGVPYSLNTILNKETIPKLSSYFNFLKKLKYNDEWCLLRELPNNKNRNYFSKALVKELIEKVIMFRKKSSKQIYLGNPWPFCAYEPEIIKKLVTYNCRILDVRHNNLAFDSNGDIVPCTVIKFEKSYLKKPLTLLEQYEKNIRLRKYINLNIPNQCKNCPLFNGCFSGCRAISFNKYGDYKHMDPQAHPKDYL